MRSNFNLSCFFLMLFLSVDCVVNEERSTLEWLSLGVSKILDFIFTPEEELDENDIHYYIFNRSIIGNEEGSENSATQQRNLYFIIHGYMSGRNRTWYTELTKQILYKHPDSFVVQVSWENLANQLYTISKRYTEHIGFKLAQLIIALELDYDVSPERIILIGHSLGAQISGWAGRLFTKITGKKLQRIIALDPAQPLFKNVKRNGRLNANDAQVVVVVHTDPFFGFTSPCGTVDFYVNGGQSQDICRNVTDWQERLYCDHSSSYTYFTNAVSHPDSYIGDACFSWEKCKKGIVDVKEEKASMGDLEINQTGLFYVKTPDY